MAADNHTYILQLRFQHLQMTEEILRILNRLLIIILSECFQLNETLYNFIIL